MSCHLRKAVIIAVLWLSPHVVFAGQCEANYKSSGSMFKGKTYETTVDVPGVDPSIALDRLAKELVTEDFTVVSTDREHGVIDATASLPSRRTAPVRITALPIDGGTRVSFSIAFPGGVVGNAATKAAICRYVGFAAIDPATRYHHDLVSYVRTNEAASDKVAVVESSARKRVAKIAVGALVGALVGAAHAKLTGGDIGKEAALGAVAGGVLTFAITKIQDKRLANRDAVATAEAYEPSQGYRSGVRDIRVTPASVKPGGTITVVTTYWALSPNPSESVGLYRYAGISVGGAYLRGFKFNPEPFRLEKGGGEYQTTMEIELPAAVSPGSYGIQWVIDGQSTGSDQQATFTVTG